MGKWVKERLDKIMEVNPKSDCLPSEFIYIDLESVKQGRLLQQKIVGKDGAPSRAQRTLKPKDVLFQLVRPYQQNNYYFEPHDERDYVASTGYAVLRTDQDAKFCYFLLHRNEFQNRVEALCTGTGYPAITPKELSRIDICHPVSLDEQRHIAGILTACDEVIEKSEAVVEKYRAIKAGMLKDLFTRGIGKNGKLRPPPESAPQLYKDTALGKVPREWEVVPLGKLFAVQLGKMLDAAKNVGVKKPYLGNRAVQWGRIDVADIETVRLTDDDLSRFRLLKGDLLVCEGGEVGRAAIWQDELPECYYQKALHRVRLKEGMCYSIPFLFYQLQLFAYRRLFDTFVTQTSIAHLTKEKLEIVPIFDVELNEQQRIAERLSAIDAKIADELAVVAKYRKVKTGLMARLLTPPDGEVE